MKFENPDKISEDILFIRQTLHGNKAAFEKLVLKYRSAIYALALSYVKNTADAEDLTQEVFIKAYRNLACLKNLERFPFWLRQITRNHCKNWLKRHGERHVSFEEVKVAEATNMASSPEEMALKQELREIVWQAIDSLLEIDRKLIEARYLENASLKQLQADYGLSYCAVAGRLKRAKQKVRETVQKLLSGFFALPGREILLPSLEGAGGGLEKLMLGGIEAVKLSLKTKLVTVGVAVILGFGGAGVWLWHSKPAPKPSVTQQEVKSPKAAPAVATPKVVIPNPALKVAPQKQPTKPPSQIDKKQEGVSDEEWAELEQPQIEQTEKQDEAASSETAEKNLTPDEQRKVAIFAELATFLPRFKELDGEFMRISQEFSDYNTRYIGREFDDQGRRVSEVRDEYDAKIEELQKLILPYQERIDELFPGSITYGTYNGAKVITGFTTNIMHSYFAPKEPPWDGNSDYFSAKEAP
jgi:RNA polymerase sigma-70 factor (ECF subfamily)